MFRLLSTLLAMVLVIVVIGSFPTKEEPLSLPLPQEAPGSDTLASEAPLTDTLEIVPNKEVESPEEEPPTTLNPSKSPEPEPVLPPSPPPAARPKPAQPYAVGPMPVDEINVRMRAALVNILCFSEPPLKSTSGSGILIDADGLILTNAHIGQYVLLEDSGASVSCVGRTGSPAVAEWRLETVYFPEWWARRYASSLTAPKPTGTGERDFALLRVVRETRDPLPHVPLDEREAAIFGEVVLGGYPAEFVKSSSIQGQLNALSALSSVKELYTFGTETLDAFSVGSNPLAQQGSSGGAVLNAWGFLIGLIATRTEGANTGERELRAISLPHIARVIAETTGVTLDDISREPYTPSLQAETRRAGDALLEVLP